jgi:hypothetical protein
MGMEGVAEDDTKSEHERSGIMDEKVELLRIEDECKYDDATALEEVGPM